VTAAKAPTRIQKSGRGHSYFLDGEKVPGVTTILGNGVPKPALVGWAARTVAEYVTDRLTMKDYTRPGGQADLRVEADELLEALRKFNETSKYPEKWRAGELNRGTLSKVLARVQYADRDAAANRGTEVHRLAELLARGEEIEVPEELVGHVDSYRRFLDDFDPTDAVLERVVVNRRWRYMGRLDSIMTIEHPALGRTLLDVKTSRSGPFEEVGLQLAAYRFAETMLVEDGTEVPMEQVDACAVVWVRADGYDVIPFRADESTFRVFLYAKQVGEWLDRDHGGGASEKGEALQPAVRS
jgi:hypothetical protein